VPVGLQAAQERATFLPTVSCLEHLRRIKDSHLIPAYFIETQQELELSKFEILGIVLGGRLLSVPSFVEAKRYPLKAEFGKDEVLFMLMRDDDFCSFVNGLEKRSLDTTTCVEVRRSPFGGLGLFTTKDCSPGDLLLSERPMVSTVAS
jgi:hypothetical protein